MTQGDTRRSAWGQISLYINSRPCPSQNRQQLAIAITLRLIAHFARLAAPWIIIILLPLSRCCLQPFQKKVHLATTQDTKTNLTSIYLVLDEGAIYQTAQTMLLPHFIFLKKARTILPLARLSSPRRNALSWND